MNDQVIVYRSRQEQLTDQFMMDTVWPFIYDARWLIIGILIGIILIGLFVSRKSRRFRRY